MVYSHTGIGWIWDDYLFPRPLPDLLATSYHYHFNEDGTLLYSMRLRNLRSFSGSETSPFIDLKPLTVLIGKNSSGKSTFLRSFPLLRQSVEAKTSGPILWYGSYVDFGAFSEAKIHDDNIDTIYFDFKVKSLIPKLDEYLLWPDAYWHDSDIGSSKVELNAIVQFGVCESGNKNIPKYLKLTIDKFEYEWRCSGEKFSLYINGKEEPGMDPLIILPYSTFLPLFGRIVKRERELGGEKVSVNTLDSNYFHSFFSLKLRNYLKRYSHGSISTKSLDEGINRLGLLERKDVGGILEKTFRKNTTLMNNLKSNKNEICDFVYEMCICKNLFRILKGVSNDLESAFKNVRYIAPLRATAERYYRYQDLQVNEIDHTGSNLAMLLRSLSDQENTKFSGWTRDNFGFGVRVEELGLHYALKIQTENDTREYNINDMGFGFSQMLPIIASIWMETRQNRMGLPSRNASKRFIFTIEQPELHLHPEYQSRLAKMFAAVVKSAKEQKVDLVILFETHSKTMVDTLGDCIEDKLIEKDDVNIVLFEKELGENRAKVRFSGFDQVGNLVEWPVGFFSGRA